MSIDEALLYLFLLLLLEFCDADAAGGDTFAKVESSTVLVSRRLAWVARKDTRQAWDIVGTICELNSIHLQMHGLMRVMREAQRIFIVRHSTIQNQ